MPPFRGYSNAYFYLVLVLKHRPARTPSYQRRKSGGPREGGGRDERLSNAPGKLQTAIVGFLKHVTASLVKSEASFRLSFPKKSGVNRYPSFFSGGMRWPDADLTERIRPATFVLRVSVSLAPGRVDVDCRSQAFHTPRATKAPLL